MSCLYKSKYNKSDKEKLSVKLDKSKDLKLEGKDYVIKKRK